MEVLKPVLNQSAETNNPTDEYHLDQQVGHLLRRAYQRHTAIFTENQKPHGLTAPQWAALYKLWEVGEVSQNKLGRLIAVDAATMQGLAQRLMKRGLLHSRQDTEDRRRSVLQLTQEGVDMIDKMLPSAVKITQETLSPLTQRERGTLINLLRKIT